MSGNQLPQALLTALTGKLRLGVPAEDVISIHIGFKTGSIMVDVAARDSNGELQHDPFGVRTKRLYRNIAGDGDVDIASALGPRP